MDATHRISLTPTVARQTPRQEFGALLKHGLQSGAQVAGTLLQGMPAAGIVSAAVSNVATLAAGGSALAGQAASAGITAVGGHAALAGPVTAQALATSPHGAPGELGGMIGLMRAEADRSMALQMQMQTESREYNTLSNVLKTRHDSAKAAINNIR